MNNTKKRVIRFIAGIILLILFVIFAYLSCKYSVHSSICYPNYDMSRGDNNVFFYDRQKFISTQPEGREKAFWDIKYGPEDTNEENFTDYEEEKIEPIETSLEVESTEITHSALKAQEKGLPAPPEIDINEWQYILVNGDNPLDPVDYAPAELVYINMTGDDTYIRTDYDGNRQVVDRRIAQALVDFAQGCKAAGLPVYLSSGYRSYAEQQANFTRVCANNGCTDGKDANGHYITMPAGCSEHQTGLCCDITDVYHEIKNAEIEKTDTFKWLKEHCTEYGFVHRFPEGKEEITSVMYEPFHFRYVGVEAAKYMTENNICLEEFVELYK